MPNPLILRYIAENPPIKENHKSHIATIYAAYLANTKFGELEYNANLQTFDLANRAILSVDCCITHMTIISVGIH